MSDQCRTCEAKGDWDKCLSTPCFHHENWFAKEALSRLSSKTAFVPLEWRKDTHSGDIGVAGKVKLFTICFNLLKPKGEDRAAYNLYCELPQVKVTEHPSFEAAKQKAQEIYERYLKRFIVEGGSQ